MKILYVTPESPLNPSGGITTYIGMAAAGMKAAGHDIYMITWYYRKLDPKGTYEPFDSSNVDALRVDGEEIKRLYPHGPYNTAFSYWLSNKIEEAVRRWDIDVVESTDFLSPSQHFFSHAQTTRSLRDRLLVTYNHGFIGDLYMADQIVPQQSIQDELAGERQQCRVSDLVIAPSRAVQRRLSGHGIRNNVSVVREPYQFRDSWNNRDYTGAFTYLGRISIGKGIDKLIYLLNAAAEVVPIGRITLAGLLADTPFRTSDIREYVAKRLPRDLSDRVEFTGTLRRDRALALLEGGDLTAHLGVAETFSYTCIESIDAGLFPVLAEGTSMSEFLPPGLEKHLLPEKMSTPRQLASVVEGIVAAGPPLVAEIREFCVAELSPHKIAADMTRVYEEKWQEKRGRISVATPWRAVLDDVTILIPAYNPGADLFDCIESIRNQTAGEPKVLMCDDGSDQSASDFFEAAEHGLDRLRIVRQVNGGLLAARNTLIEECDTRLAVFLDCDDRLAPRYLERSLEAYNASLDRPEAVICMRRNFGESTELVVRHILEDPLHLVRNDLRMTALIETEVLRAIGFDGSRRNGEADDWAFWCDFVGRGYRASFVPDPLFQYRFRQGSMSWPWSDGQRIGSLVMLKDVALRFAEQENSEMARRLAWAIYHLNAARN